jgi:hypothetical protein
MDLVEGKYFNDVGSNLAELWRCPLTFPIFDFIFL